MKLTNRVLMICVAVLSAAVVYLGWQLHEATVFSRPEALDPIPESARSLFPAGRDSNGDSEKSAAAESDDGLPEFPAESLKRAAAAVPKGKPPSARDLATNAQWLGYFQSITNRYYRGDPLDQAIELLNQLVDGYNQWVRSIDEGHKNALNRLESQVASLHMIEKQIDDLDQRLKEKPNSLDRSAVESYNSIVKQRNDLVRQHNQFVESYKQLEKEYNDAVARSNGEVKVQRQQLDALRKAVDEQTAIYKQWTANNGDTTFFQQLNHFYAQLCSQWRSGQSPELDPAIGQVLQIRRELAAHAVRSHEKSVTGLVIVEATLGRQATCYLVVDTGASTVTIPPAMVEALGLSDRLGREVEISLAGGMKIVGRELVIPSLSVLGQEATDVRAVVLDESEVGVDGLLGLSFLNRFDFRIDRQRPDKLTLRPKAGK
jgi:clan AA aspartic protease (TIGR02281 family)